MMKFPHLFQTLKIGKLISANRIESAPMSVVNTTPEGYLTSENIAHYELRAQGGAGIVSIGESLVHPSGNSHDRMIPLYDSRCLPSLITAVEAIKRHGALASLQLNHAGMRANPKFCPEGKVYGPESIESYVYGSPVIKLDPEMIHSLVEAYGDAAEMAKLAGADMCMVHGGHGWILAQFLSPYSNHRNDEFGGSLENRARLSLMVIENIRKKCGPDFPIEFRMSGDEFMEGGMTQEEGIELAKILDGKVDILHVSATTFLDKEASIRMFPTSFAERGCNVYLAAAIKKVVTKSLVCTLGGLDAPEHMERILAEEQADLVAIGRGLLADPYLPHKAKNGLESDITPCIRCMLCISNNFVPYVKYATMLSRCSVNPVIGRELEFSALPQPKSRKKVLIIGGGPGGLTAALTAADRGHEVILCEKRGVLGGALRYATHPGFKADLRAYTELLIQRVLDQAIQIRLNTEVTPEIAREIGADLIIAALGAELCVPAIPGVDGEDVYLATALNSYEDLPGKKIVVVGGGLVGCEEGLALAQEGREVMIVEQLSAAAQDAPIIHWKAMMKEMRNMENLQLLLDSTCFKIVPKGVWIKDADGRERLLEADAVLIATGLKANREAAEAFRCCAPAFRVIGDSLKPAKIVDAVWGGYSAALDA